MLALLNTSTLVTRTTHEGPFKCYLTLFSWKLDPHPPPRNGNNVEPYTRPGVNPPSTIPNPIPVDFLIPNPIPVNLAMIPNPFIQ